MSDYKTYNAKKLEVEKKWYLIDAKDKILGRISTEIAKRLQGKHKCEYTPHIDTGDHIVVINAEKINVSGKKTTDKKYYRHSGYVGSLKSTAFRDLLAKQPEKVIKIAVKGMLPKSKMGNSMIKKLKICIGNSHPYECQKPEKLEI